ASIPETKRLSSAIEATIRNGFSTYVTSTGTVSRELYKFDADPRNTEDLLGKGDLTIDNNTFYLTSPYNNAYRAIKTCNLLLDALDGTKAVDGNEADGYRGYANTMKAMMYSRVINLLNDNGLRFDVADPDNLGPFIGKQAAFDAILALLDEANSQLSGATFTFQLSAGFSGFDTPSSFAQFNRALAARVATHAGQYSQALGYLNASFYDINGNLSTGPKHLFSTNPNDFLNPLFKTAGQSGDQIIVHNDLLADAEAGDMRLSKFRERVEATSQDGLNGTHETALYANSTSPIDIIRNEELVLIYAEGSLQTGALGEAVAALNTIRNAAGLSDYSGAETSDALTDELLNQRRYSLWGEGHRMVDLRRYGRLNADFVPIDREGDDVFTQFPIPLTENQ
ncbi:MAG: RagB/SusD family nutrient uptake outer membrane protein, partial [Bacteroidota bacterium]